MVYYLDTSALVKRYVAEIGSRWITDICARTDGNNSMTAMITKAEAAAALSSKLRQGGLSAVDYTGALQDLDYDFAQEYMLVTIDLSLVELAVQLTKRQKLRGYDAIQLAAALTANDLIIQADLPPLTLISADTELLYAAQSEGLPIDNPTLHP